MTLVEGLELNVDIDVELTDRPREDVIATLDVLLNEVVTEIEAVDDPFVVPAVTRIEVVLLDAEDEARPLGLDETEVPTPDVKDVDWLDCAVEFESGKRTELDVDPDVESGLVKPLDPEVFGIDVTPVLLEKMVDRALDVTLVLTLAVEGDVVMLLFDGRKTLVVTTTDVELSPADVVKLPFVLVRDKPVLDAGDVDVTFENGNDVEAEEVPFGVPLVSDVLKGAELPSAVPLDGIDVAELVRLELFPNGTDVELAEATEPEGVLKYGNVPMVEGEYEEPVAVELRALVERDWPDE